MVPGGANATSLYDKFFLVEGTLTELGDGAGLEEADLMTEDFSMLPDETAVGVAGFGLKLELFKSFFDIGLGALLAGTASLGDDVLEGEKLGEDLPRYRALSPLFIAFVLSFARLGLLEPEDLRDERDRLFGTASCHPSSDVSPWATSSSTAFKVEK